MKHIVIALENIYLNFIFFYLFKIFPKTQILLVLYTDFAKKKTKTTLIYVSFFMKVFFVVFNIQFLNVFRNYTFNVIKNLIYN